MTTNRPFMVFSGTKSRYLAEQITEELGCKLGNMIITHFADGEFAVSYEESVRGKDVFLVQSTFPNSDNLMELLLMIDAAKRASAHSIIAVMPYVGWVQQNQYADQGNAIEANLFLFHVIPPQTARVAACMIFSCDASAMSISAVFLPSHITMMRSLMRRISVISEEIMMMDLPCATSSFIS